MNSPSHSQSFSAAPNPDLASSYGVKLPAYTEHRLSTGATILLMERHDVPLLAFSARIRSGSVADPDGKEGLATLTADLLQKGAGKRTAEQFADTVDSAGGVLTSTSSREAIVINGSFLARDASLAIALLGEMLQQPAFDATQLDKSRELLAEEIAAAKDSDLRNVIGTYFNAFHFGAHPYGKPVRGSEATLPKITREDVLKYYHDNFGADRIVLAVVGDFESKPMLAELESLFGTWTKGAAPAPLVVRSEPLKGRRVLLVDKPDATQTYFWIGNTGIAMNDPYRVGADIANTMFGGRFTSLINRELRVKSGLTYSANSRLARETQPGAFNISSYTKTDSTEKAVDLALHVLGDYRKSGICDEDLASVKTYLLGQFLPGIETASQLASRLADLRFYGMDGSEVDQYAVRVAALSGADVGDVIRRIFPSPDDLTFVFIGKASVIRDVVKKYGPVTGMKITDPRFSPL